MRTIILATALLALGVGLSQGQSPTPPTVVFSKDEKTVTVRYDKGEWAFYRPVVTPSAFKAAGKSLWVALNGNDADDGTIETPFRTIGKAVEAVAAGDVIYVRSGTYVENILIKKSGEEGKPIILRCATGDLGKVKITPAKEWQFLAGIKERASLQTPLREHNSP